MPEKLKEPRLRLQILLKDYSMEEILETCDLDPIDALEYLIVYGVLSLDEIVEATDVEV